MKKKIAICHSQVPFFKGGAELLVQSLAIELNKRGYQSEIVSVPFKWYPNNQLIQSMVNWRGIDLSESNGEKIDLVIGTKFPSYGIQHHNKVTWLVHQYRQVYDLLGTKYSQYGSSPEDYSIRELVKRFDHNSLLESKKIYTIADNATNRLRNFNNIQSETLYHPPKHVGSYYSNEIGDYVLSVGRLDKLKRTDFLIEAMAYTNSNMKCVIAGEGPEKENLKRLVEKLNLKDRVIFLGFVEDKTLLDLYANCLAVYYAPFDEDYGYVTLEAFLSKKPVISRHDSGGVLEFLVKESNGFILEETEDIAEKLNFLLDNKHVASSMGNNGYNDIQHITWDNAIDKLTETIR